MSKNQFVMKKRFFNVSNKNDVAAFKQFLTSGTWGKDCCPFHIEEPHLSIPDMIKDKLVRHFLKV